MIVEERPTRAASRRSRSRERAPHPVGDQRAGTGHRARAPLQALRRARRQRQVVDEPENEPQDHRRVLAPKSTSRPRRRARASQQAAVRSSGGATSCTAGPGVPRGKLVARRCAAAPGAPAPRRRTSAARPRRPVRSRDRVEHERRIEHGAGQRAETIQWRQSLVVRRPRDPPDLRLEPEQPATGGGNADRAGAVRRQRRGHDPRRDGGRRPAARPAGRALRIPRVTRDAPRDRFRERPQPELGHGRLADDTAPAARSRRTTSASAAAGRRRSRRSRGS